jgi:hypothetical protein
MADISDNLRYLIEALRTSPSPASATPQTGPNAGVSMQSSPAGLAPLEQRRDGYRLYQQEKKASGEQPVSYQEWYNQQTPE